MAPRKLVWLVYDVRSDRTRGRVSAQCLRLGLERVQKSVFMGLVDPSRLDEMMLSLEGCIDPATDSVYAFPFAESELKAARVVGAAFDRVRVLDEEILRCR